MLEKLPDAGEQSSRLKLERPCSIRRLLAKAAAGCLTFGSIGAVSSIDGYGNGRSVR